MPRLPFAQKAVRRFMPGETLEKAVEAARGLSGKGFGVVFTILGEDVATEADAHAVVSGYLELIDALRDTEIDGQLSVKPTQLGLALGSRTAEDCLGVLGAATEKAGIPIWVDMEGSGSVDATLRLYRGLRARHDQAGLCLQAYLRRTPSDLEALLPLEPRIRLVKGAYAEPAEVAFTRKTEVDEAYRGLTSTLLAAAGRGRASCILGTHDSRLIEAAWIGAGALDVPHGGFEVHMLYGIRVAEQERLAAKGVPVKILVSYGSAWFPWYMRRLAERPANLWFVAGSLIPG
ncbi:MAG: proline dehydrogenase family protein [Gemmatimonadota bacterium]